MKFLNIGIAGLSLFILNQILFGIVELHLDVVEGTAVGFSLSINGIILRQAGHGLYFWADIDNGRRQGEGPIEALELVIIIVHDDLSLGEGG